MVWNIERLVSLRRAQHAARAVAWFHGPCAGSARKQHRRRLGCNGRRLSQSTTQSVAPAKQLSHPREPPSPEALALDPRTAPWTRRQLAQSSNGVVWLACVDGHVDLRLPFTRRERATTAVGSALKNRPKESNFQGKGVTRKGTLVEMIPRDVHSRQVAGSRSTTSARESPGDVRSR